MTNNAIRLKQIAAWAIASVFILGFFSHSVGAITGTILGAWLVGTQRVGRGMIWMLAPGLVFGLPGIVRGAIHAETGALAYVGWTLLAMVLGMLPFTFHRIISPRLRGYVSALPLPLFATLFAFLERAWLPAGVAVHSGNPGLALRQLDAAFAPGASLFFIYWFAATVVWVWNHNLRESKIWLGVSLFAAVGVLTAGYVLFRRVSGAVALEPALTGASFAWMCLAAVLALSAWALVATMKNRGWKCRSETLHNSRSPITGEALHLINEGRGETLVSSSGERFSFLDGIADLRRPEDLTGDNGKYNQLYETIGGFYNDIQRVVCALQGFDGDAYVMSYMSLLEVKPGDSVLETSVGTGLNFKYLPRGVSLTGIDLSPEMLVNCRANMQRWGLEADLFMGNAESLPFADASFDVVFHVGGINFFNDRAKAIQEMIRVAKPGSKILIADETEEHVQEMYERGPITNLFFRNRKVPVKAPVDLVPGEMLEKQLELLKRMGKNRFYALTFRKPGKSDQSADPGAETDILQPRCIGLSSSEGRQGRLGFKVPVESPPTWR